MATWPVGLCSCAAPTNAGAKSPAATHTPSNAGTGSTHVYTTISLTPSPPPPPTFPNHLSTHTRLHGPPPPRPPPHLRTSPAHPVRAPSASPLPPSPSLCLPRTSMDTPISSMPSSRKATPTAMGTLAQWQLSQSDQGSSVSQMICPGGGSQGARRGGGGCVHACFSQMAPLAGARGRGAGQPQLYRAIAGGRGPPRAGGKGAARLGAPAARPRRAGLRRSPAAAGGAEAQDAP